MRSTPRHPSASAAHVLLFLAMATAANADGLNAMTYKGCFSSSTPLKDQGSYTYQTSGYCQPICVKQNQAVLALSGGSDCWCGSELPSASSKVDDSKCNTPCDGYDSQMCGGNGFYSVYLTGTTDSVPSYGGSSSDSGSSPSPSSPPSQTTAAPSVVTHISPGKTVVVTQTPSSASSSSSSSGGGGTSVAGVAAGVVVGVVLAGALIAGLFFWLRHRRRKAAENEYNRSNQVADFMRKPPPTGYSSTSDARLDPEAGNRRNSVGSIADDQDFSRKILRVANPDRGSLTPAQQAHFRS